MMSGLQTDILKSRNGILINRSFEAFVRRNGLDDFDRVMSLRGEIVKRAVPERMTIRCPLPDDEDASEIYIKRSYPLRAGRFFLRLLKLAPPETACDEFQSIIAFREAGLPTMVPIAAGKRRRGLLQAESFLITRGLTGCTRLDEFFSQSGDIGRKRKRTLIRKTALLVKKMHECGFNHRDLYLCHLLMSPAEELFVVDLHRVDRRRRVPVRWIIKDLAALEYSAPGTVISRADRARFFRIYCGAGRLGAGQKQFARKVLNKTQKMIQHNTKKERSGKNPCETAF